MPRYKGELADLGRGWSRVGVLLVNLGSPDAPTPTALRRYLREFLWDPRVVEMPRPLWWLILNGIILPRRAGRSAANYQKIWRESEGSPLLAISRQQLAGIGQRLQERHGEHVLTALAMRYGRPSIAEGLEQLRQRGAGRLIVLPLYPQYSATTTASVLDAVFDELQTWRLVPELRSINRYHQQAGYIRALASSIREHWQREAPAERLLFSFHGLPQRYLDKGDPYYHECLATAEAVATELQLERARWAVSFQSRFGREAWLQPYTDKTLKEWAKGGVRSVEVICPGFAADCLETLEEIDQENRAVFLDNGGELFHYIPALNARDDHLDMLAGLVESHATGWLDS